MLLAATLLVAPTLHAQAPGGLPVCVSLPQGGVDAGYLRCLATQLTVPPEAAADRRAAVAQASSARIAREPAAVGLYTRAATELRLGPNFGTSPVPYRPATVFTHPLLPPPATR